MSEPTEAEVEAASRALTERGVIIPRGYLRLALTAAAQVREQEQQKFVDDFLAQGGRIIPTADDPGPVLTGWGPKSSAVLGDRVAKEQQ